MSISEFKVGTNDWFVGLSTDTKPTNASPGDMFTETDTGNQFMWNGAWFASLSVIRGNIDSTILTLTAAAAGANSADQINFNGRGVAIGVNISALTGTTPTLTVTVQGKDVASGQYYTLLASTALAAVAFTPLIIYPGLVAAANAVANTVLPRTWRISTAIAGTTPAVTATIGASILR